MLRFRLSRLSSALKVSSGGRAARVPPKPSAAAFFSLHKFLLFWWILSFLLLSCSLSYAAVLREFRSSAFEQQPYSKSNFQLLPSPPLAAQKEVPPLPAASFWRLSFSPVQLRSLGYSPEAYFLASGFQGEALVFNGVSFEEGIRFNATAPFWRQPALAGFSISFYFQPTLPFPLQGESLLVEKRGLAYQAAANQLELTPLFRGFQVGIKNGKLFARFENSFAFGSSALPTGRRLLSLSLSQALPESFDPKKWHQVLVRYDARSSVIALYLDGRLQAQRYTTAAGTPSSTAYFFTLAELASYPLRLGQRFLGKIDELTFYASPHPKTLRSPFSTQLPSPPRAFSPNAGWDEAHYPQAEVVGDQLYDRKGQFQGEKKCKPLTVNALPQRAEGQPPFSYLLQGLEPRTRYYFALSAHPLTQVSSVRPPAVAF